MRERLMGEAREAAVWGVRWGIRLGVALLFVGLVWLGFADQVAIRRGARAGEDAQAYLLQLQAAGMAPTGQVLAKAIEQRAAAAQQQARPAEAPKEK